jgi:UDP-galactopyranose mutase
MSHSSQNILVVGAGFSGATVARQLAEAGHKVTVIDKKDHLGGHAYDFVNASGIRVHKYGPHIFHTSNQKVVDFLTRFTEWVDYKHKVKAMLANGRLVTLPVNAETSAVVGPDRVLDTFFRPYTRKMWGVELEELDKDVLKRVPVRSDMNEFYFPNDSFQAMPKHGYTKLFEALLSHANIQVNLNTPYSHDLSREYLHTFNSMPIDEYFGFQLGELPYRSIKFHHFSLPVPKLFEVSVVNFTDDGPYTRITEWKNFPNHGLSEGISSFTLEEPCDYKVNNMERYYPVKDLRGESSGIYKAYAKLCPANVTFIGRCGLYVYLDMHQAVSSAMAIASNFLRFGQGCVGEGGSKRP